MVTVQNTVQYVDNQVYITSTYYGLSTDTPKPTEGVGNGSAFIEMDTGKLYFFDLDNTSWLEWGGSSGGGSEV